MPYDKDKVKDAPRVFDSDGHLSEEPAWRAESEPFRSYGVTRSAGYAGTSGTRTDAPGAVGRARLRRFVETEQVTETVPVREERAVVEREPITEDVRKEEIVVEEGADAPRH